MNAQRRRTRSVSGGGSFSKASGQKPPRPPRESFYEHADKPSSIFDTNSTTFLRSLRPLQPKRSLRSDLARYYQLSRRLVDDFVRVKAADFDRKMEKTNKMVLVGLNDGGHHHHQQQQQQQEVVDVVPSPSRRKIIKKTVVRPKSANTSNNKVTVGTTTTTATSSLRQTSGMSKSSPRLNGHQEEDDEGRDAAMGTDDHLEPIFHRSLDRISSIANWEKQIRYELEIEKELQRRELDRQKEKLQHDQRKLSEWDRQLRIELDARERKVRLSELELQARLEEIGQKGEELQRRETIVTEIVNERLKTEMRIEVDKLRKKFNELEGDRTSLAKKEERLREAEARLHEQVKLVKAKIDTKRTSDIELAKSRKELEIVRKENEVLRDKVESMEDYQLTKYENRALKNELACLKEALEAKTSELERDRDRWERDQRANDQKIGQLKAELRKSEQDAALQSQRSADDLEVMSTKYEATSCQVKRLKAFIKNQLTKINHDLPLSQTLYRHSSHTNLNVGAKSVHNLSNVGVSMSPHHHHHHHQQQQQQQPQHSRDHSFHNVRTTRRVSNQRHVRSLSMDSGSGHDPQRASRGNGQPRGCHLCDDNDAELFNNDKVMMLFDNGDMVFDEEQRDDNNSHLMFPEEEEEEEDEDLLVMDTLEDNKATRSEEKEKMIVQTIVDRIYEPLAGHEPAMSNDQHISSPKVISEDVPRRPEGVAQPPRRSLYDQLVASTDQLSLGGGGDDGSNNVGSNKLPVMGTTTTTTTLMPIESNDANNNQVKLDTFTTRPTTNTTTSNQQQQQRNDGGGHDQHHSSPSSISESFEVDW